ncbi:hypothetical protein HMPREF1987_02004 [Peptostreptococcaceae bacterium oral taxon 113 str. W5053]|nr:hypothetical protein HMPREF1987_02004 [Peptostreptococcaceae bacterium oral taxon 113 str. W5053]
MRLPVPEGMKAPFKRTVGGVVATFEETDHGTIAFARLMK